MSLLGERSAPSDGAETVATPKLAKPKRAYLQPSLDLRNWVVDYVLQRHLQGWDNKTIAERDACDVLVPTLREKCDRAGEAACPDLRGVDAAHLRQIGRATWHETQIQVSRRIRRDQENDGPQASGHALGQAPIALNVLRDGVQSAPFPHHQHGRDGSKAVGPGVAGRNRKRWTGALHRRRGQAKSHDLDGRDQNA